MRVYPLKMPRFAVISVVENFFDGKMSIRLDLNATESNESRFLSFDSTYIHVCFVRLLCQRWNFFFENEAFFSLPSPTPSAQSGRCQETRDERREEDFLYWRNAPTNRRRTSSSFVFTPFQSRQDKTGREMKCFCKYCSSTFVCQRQSPADLCYYRHAIGPNITDDYGCVQADGSKFLRESRLRSEK